MAALHAATFTTPRPWGEGEFAALLDMPGTFTVTKGAACFALGRVAADEAELLTIATAPTAQRRGLARQALADFEREAAARGASRAFLEVAETNHAARALYAAAGWGESGRRRAYYRQPDGVKLDALILSKPLIAA